MPEQTLKEKTAKGLFWGGISNGLQQILGLVFGIVLARILSPEDYGMVGMLAIFTGIAGTIQESGFTAALVNKPEIKHEDYNAVFWFSLLTGVVLYVILFFCAPLIAWFYEKPELTNLSRLVFLGFLFGGIGIAHNAILFKKLMVKERAKIDVAALVVSGVVGLVMALNGFAYWGLAVQSTTYIGVGTLLRWFYSPWRPTFRFNFQPLREMFGFSFKLLLTNIFYQLNNNIFSVLLGRFYTAAQVGYYSQGNKWMGMGQAVIGGMLASIAQPIFAHLLLDDERLVNVFHKLLRFTAFVVFPVMLGLAFVSEELILITIKDKWLPSVPILQILCVWGAFNPIWLLHTQLLISRGRSDIYLWVNIVFSVFQLSMIVLVYSSGIIYMVIVYVLTYILGLFVWQYFVNRLIGLRLISVIKDITPYLCITLLTFIITYYFTCGIANIYIRFITKILMASMFYLSIVWLCNSVIIKDILSFLKEKKL